MSRAATADATLVGPAGGTRVRAAGRAFKLAAVSLIFATVTVSILYPLYFLTATALRSESDYLQNPAGFPAELTLTNVTNAFERAHIGQYALNSLLVVVPSAILLATMACLAAYALVHLDFPLRRSALVGVVAMMALPPIVLLIPIFKVIRDAGLLNQRPGLILVYTALNLPFSIYLLASFMRGIPRELLNAAWIDGAGALRTLWSVVIPLVRPALLTLITLNFLVLWNELLFSLVLLQDESLRTIMVGIAETQGKFEKNLGVVSAGLLMSMIPPLLIFAFFQRSLARGLTAGAVK